MKKVVIILLVALITCNASTQNQQISYVEAVIAASNWVRDNYPACRSSYNITCLTNASGDTLLYEIMFDSITVLMSGSKSCMPILGTYKNGEPLLPNLEVLPCNLKSLINTYMDEIDSCFANDTITLYHRSDWEVMKNRWSAMSLRSTVVVGPLISTKWGQDSSNTGGERYAYNYFITDQQYLQSPPYCLHCLVGCGAVALAQVMNYWQYPVLRYNAQKQFDWCNMTNTLDYGSPGYEIARDAIAHLMNECAMDIDSRFGCGLTTSFLGNTRRALVEMYNYNNSASYIKRSDFTGDWETLIKYNLDTGHPVIYRGDGSGGHAFVCDGYRDDGMYHINWGWRGYYDGYFYLDVLAPANHNYSNDQAAIVFIEPSSNTSICEVNLDLDDFFTHSPLLIPLGAQHIVPQTMTTLVSASINSQPSWRTIYSGDNVSYKAHKEIILRDGFTVEGGAEFVAKITPCPNCENNGNGEEVIGMYDEHEDSSTETSPNYQANAHKTTKTPADIYPNPTDGELTMTVDGEVESVVILDVNGNPQGGWDFVSITDERITLNVRRLNAGAYILVVRHSDGNLETARFIKQ